MILVSILLMWPFEINETLEWKLSFAVSALPVRIMSQTADVHELSAAFIRTHRDLVIRVQDDLAHAVGLQLRDQSLGLLVDSLSEEKHIEVVEALVKVTRQRGHVRETLQRVLVELHEVFEIHDLHLLQNVLPALL